MDVIIENGILARFNLSEIPGLAVDHHFTGPFIDKLIELDPTGGEGVHGKGEMMLRHLQDEGDIFMAGGGDLGESVGGDTYIKYSAAARVQHKGVIGIMGDHEHDKEAVVNSGVWREVGFEVLDVHPPEVVETEILVKMRGG